MLFSENNIETEKIMSKVYCIRRRQKGKNLTFGEREELEAIVNKNNKLPSKERLSQRKMAERMGVSPPTLSRELRSSRVILRDFQWREVVSYSAMKAQDDYDVKASAKGAHLKIGKNIELEKKIEEYIIDENYSPYATIEVLKKDPIYLKTPISVRTLYNYIEKEVGFRDFRNPGMAQFLPKKNIRWQECKRDK